MAINEDYSNSLFIFFFFPSKGFVEEELSLVYASSVVRWPVVNLLFYSGKLLLLAVTVFQ